MQVSRYIAPLDQQNLISAMEETSTDTLSTKSPRPMYLSSSREKLSRVSVILTTLMPYSSATCLPRSSDVMMVMRSLATPTWRRTSGSVP